MKRAFAVDVLRCGNCGARRQVIALITDPGLVHRSLTHLAHTRKLRAAQPPPIAPARPSHERQLWLVDTGVPWGYGLSPGLEAMDHP